jgi:hypothetical protein
MIAETFVWLAATSPPWFKAIFLFSIGLLIPGFFVAVWLMSRSHKDNKTSRPDAGPKMESKLTRAEALRSIKSFTDELKTGWERDGLEWAPELIGILVRFNQEASKDSPNRTQLESLCNEMRNFIESRKFLKGISNVLADANAVCRSESE